MTSHAMSAPHPPFYNHRAQLVILNPKTASQLYSARSSSEYTEVRKCTMTPSHVGNDYGLTLAKPGYPSPLIDRLENKAK
jgi:hypothetical protein